jgi:dolichol-phosphate mannosyltransferase
MDESLPAATRSLRDARVSIVVPVCDEAGVLPELRERIEATLERAGAAFEVIFVDDGSTDGSGALLDQMHAGDPRFKVVHLSRNFGHQAAVTAGLHYAAGDLACIMDADLQDPPEVLLSLFAEWEKGNDVVYAVRRARKEHWAKVALYEGFYRLLSRLSQVPSSTR